MYRAATVSVYDMMSAIHVSAHGRVYEWSTSSAPTGTFMVADSMRSRGEESDWLWLADALEHLADAARLQHNKHREPDA